MRQKLFIYPTGGQGPKSANPYIRHMKESLSGYFELLDPVYRWRLPRMLVFLLNSFKADVYVLNWIENSAVDRGGIIGALMSLMGLHIIKKRGATIVWVFHNIHSHEGDTFWTRKFRKFLFKNATFIISHSCEATEYAKQYARCPVYFKNHPIVREEYAKWDGDVKKCDFFFWSSILPYKGVAEFLSNPHLKESGKSVYILGRCKDINLCHLLESLTGENVIYENRMADFSEIASQCKLAKYVIFPYIGDSISSSGVLMDTLLMGGVPVGPNRGAFADLASQGCCLVYNNINEVFYLPTDETSLKLDPEKVRLFVEENSWKTFAQWFFQIVPAK